MSDISFSHNISITNHYEPSESCIKLADFYQINEKRERQKFIIWVRSKDIKASNFDKMYARWLKNIVSRRPSRAPVISHPPVELKPAKLELSGVILHTEAKSFKRNEYNHPIWPKELYIASYSCEMYLYKYLYKKLNNEVMPRQYRLWKIRALYLVSINDDNAWSLSKEDAYDRIKIQNIFMGSRAAYMIEQLQVD